MSAPRSLGHKAGGQEFNSSNPCRSSAATQCAQSTDTQHIVPIVVIMTTPGISEPASLMRFGIAGMFEPRRGLLWTCQLVFAFRCVFFFSCCPQARLQTQHCENPRSSFGCRAGQRLTCQTRDTGSHLQCVGVRVVCMSCGALRRRTVLCQQGLRSNSCA